MSREPVYKKRLPKGDYYYREGESNIHGWGKFNCEQGYNYISYFQARGVMAKVENWILNGEHWNQGGYSGNVNNMLIVLRVGPAFTRSGKLIIKDTLSDLTLAVYLNAELYDDFCRVRKPFVEREERRKREVIDAALDRVMTLLSKTSKPINKKG